MTQRVYMELQIELFEEFEIFKLVDTNRNKYFSICARLSEIRELEYNDKLKERGRELIREELGLYIKN